HRGRVRRRQRARRARHPRGLAPCVGQAGRRQLRRDPARSRRERALRPSPRRVHRRPREPKGRVRAGASGHALPRRGRRAAAGDLRNALQAYAAVGQLPPPAGGVEAPAGTFEPIVDPTMAYAEQKDAMIDEFTRAYLRALIAYTSGNQAAAARIAQLDRTYLGRLL